MDDLNSLLESFPTEFHVVIKSQSQNIPILYKSQPSQPN